MISVDRIVFWGHGLGELKTDHYLNLFLKNENLSEGTKNLVAQIADNHEQNLYLLKFQQ